ncbi:MAG: beta-propeller fold lactonase family protein [Burkholderiaceae bacterium]
MNLRTLLGRVAGTSLLLLMAACGGGGGSDPAAPATFTIGGTVSGLATGQQVTLNNNAGNPTTVTANGAFTFSTAVDSGGSYAVTVGTQPTGQTCTVSNGSGAGVNANVTNVTVTCSTRTFTIGGTVSGLAAGQQVSLNNNASNPTAVTANGAFTFSTPVAFNGSYAVTVGTQPTGQTCTVSNGSGAGVNANVTNVTVTCSTNTFTIGGTVSGLTAGQQVTLNNNASNPTTVTANGAFTFSTPVAFNGSYAVTVGTQPTGQTCTVSNGSGAGVNANVTNVTVTCSTNTFTIGGTVSGLTAGQQVTLNNNGANPTTVTANGAFTFSTRVAYGGSYAVTVGTQPTGQTCTVSNGSGSGVNANVTNVTVTCSTNTFTIGGTVSGLTAGQQVTLNNNSADPTTVSANGAFTFSTAVAYGGSYAVTIGTQPTALNCSVSNGSGSNVTANVTTVIVSCRTVYAYVVNFGDGVSTGNTISQYTVGVGGALSALGTPVATGVGPRSIAVDPKGRFAYVANGGGSSVSQYKIEADGTLTGLGSVATGTSVSSEPRSVVVDPTGKYVYVANLGDDNVSHFQIDQTNGTLTKIADSATGVRPFFVSVDPSGRFAYVANFWDTTVSQFTISATDGSLTPMSPATVTVGTVGGAAGDNPLSVTVDPLGKYAYVTIYGAKKVAQYSINQTTGALTSSGNPDVLTGNNPWPAVIAPSGQYAYWANVYDDQIAQFNVGALGALSPMSQPTESSPVNPQIVVIDSTGRYAYAVNSGNDKVTQFSIGAGGALVPMGTANVSAGSRPWSIALTR